MDVTPLGDVFPLGTSRWCWRSYGRPPKATCQASMQYPHGQGTSSSSKHPCVNEWQHHHQTLAPKYDVKLKRKMFFPSWENRLACEGWARSSTSSSRSSILHLCDLACGPLASNLWACSPMEAQARLVLPKLSTN
jgi:hypothetical protein